MLPFLFALLAGFAPERSARTLGRLGAWLTFLASLALFVGSAATGSGVFSFVENQPWLPDLGLSYKLGVDGPAILLVVLTTFLTALAVEASQTMVKGGHKAFFALMLWMESALIGSFVSLDLILFYVFFEAVLIPAYFLIGIYGGANRVAAGLKFLLYTLVGSLLMLVSIIALYLHAGQTFDYEKILTAVTASPMTGGLAAVAFGGFALAFAIKTPLFPFHTWLPDTYVESPAPVTMVLAGAMGKLGIYGFYRFVIPLFPDLARQAAPAFIWLGVAAIIYGALVAAVQRDVKRLIAYSSVSHLGFIVMGLFSGTAHGVSGAMLQAINHGVSTGALFLLVGILYERRSTNRIASFGGLWEQMPVFGRIFLIVTFSAIALPLTNGFVGEFLILLGTFHTYPLAAGVATTGVIWSAIYMLWMFQRVMYGPVARPENRRLLDVSGAEFAQLAPFVAAIFLFGIAPWIFLRVMEPSVKTMVERTAPKSAPASGIPALTQPLTPATDAPTVMDAPPTLPAPADANDTPPSAGAVAPTALDGEPSAPQSPAQSAPAPDATPVNGGTITPPVPSADRPGDVAPTEPVTGTGLDSGGSPAPTTPVAPASGAVPAASPAAPRVAAPAIP